MLYQLAFLYLYLFTETKASRLLQPPNCHIQVTGLDFAFLNHVCQATTEETALCTANLLSYKVKPDTPVDFIKRLHEVLDQKVFKNTNGKAYHQLLASIPEQFDMSTLFLITNSEFELDYTRNMRYSYERTIIHYGSAIGLDTSALKEQGPLSSKIRGLRKIVNEKAFHTLPILIKLLQSHPSIASMDAVVPQDSVELLRKLQSSLTSTLESIKEYLSFWTTVTRQVIDRRLTALDARQENHEISSASLRRLVSTETANLRAFIERQMIYTVPNGVNSLFSLEFTERQVILERLLITTLHCIFGMSNANFQTFTGDPDEDMPHLLSSPKDSLLHEKIGDYQSITSKSIDNDFIDFLRSLPVQYRSKYLSKVMQLPLHDIEATGLAEEIRDTATNCFNEVVPEKLNEINVDFEKAEMDTMLWMFKYVRSVSQVKDSIVNPLKNVDSLVSMSMDKSMMKLMEMVKLRMKFLHTKAMELMRLLKCVFPDHHFNDEKKIALVGLKLNFFERQVNVLLRDIQQMYHRYVGKNLLFSRYLSSVFQEIQKNILFSAKDKIRDIQSIRTFPTIREYTVNDVREHFKDLFLEVLRVCCCFESGMETTVHRRRFQEPYEDYSIYGEGLSNSRGN